MKLMIAFLSLLINIVLVFDKTTKRKKKKNKCSSSEYNTEEKSLKAKACLQLALLFSALWSLSHGTEETGSQSDTYIKKRTTSFFFFQIVVVERQLLCRE